MKDTNTVLVTGAFGNLGLMVLTELKQRGLHVRATDLDTPRNRKIAASMSLHDELVWADLCTVDFRLLLKNCTAVIHLAAVLPPVTDNAPALAHRINVEASLRLIDDIQCAEQKPLLVYPSSVTVFGYPEPATKLMAADDPVTATDNYTTHKLEVEQALANSCSPWCVLRVGVSVDSRTLGADLSMVKKLFNVLPDNPVHYVHPKDVATAIANSINNERATNRILLLGGDDSCRITQHQFLSAAFNALGVSLPREMSGTERYYTSWMDTVESNEILQFQQHGFATYQQDMQQRLRYLRPIVKPFAPLVLWIMAKILN